MATPASRTPVRIARGTYSDLNSSILDLLEGEICYATDQNKIYVVEGGALTEQAFLDSADIGVSVQAYDADTAKTDTAQTFSAPQRGSISTITSAATVTLDLGAAQNFELTLGHNVTFANPSNVTAGQSGVIVITQSAGTLYDISGWGTYWKFAGGTVATATQTASAVDVVAYFVESATRISCTLIPNTKNP